MYCNRCGNQINDGERYCNRCGAPVGPVSNLDNPYDVGGGQPNKSNNVGWCILGFLIPIAGIIAFFVKGSKEKKYPMNILVCSLLSIFMVIGAMYGSGGRYPTSSYRDNSEYTYHEPSNSDRDKIDNDDDDTEYVTLEPRHSDKDESDDERDDYADEHDSAESNTSSNTNSTSSKTYEKVKLGDLIDEVDSNALRASQTYKGKYVEFDAELSSIDSDGDYIIVRPMNDNSWSFTSSITCRITDQSQLDFVCSIDTGDTLTVRGKITDVGDIMGYRVRIDELS